MKAYRTARIFVALIIVAAGLAGIAGLLGALIGISSFLKLVWPSIGVMAAVAYPYYWLGYKSSVRGAYGRKRAKLSNAKPSRNGVKLLYLLLPKEQREHLPGDLEEEFTTIILPKFGARYAMIWYWWQVIRSILATNKWIGWLVGAGGLGGVAMSVGAMLKRRFYD